MTIILIHSFPPFSLTFYFLSFFLPSSPLFNQKHSCFQSVCLTTHHDFDWLSYKKESGTNQVRNRTRKSILCRRKVRSFLPSSPIPLSKERERKRSLMTSFLSSLSFLPPLSSLFFLLLSGSFSWQTVTYKYTQLFCATSTRNGTN